MFLNQTHKQTFLEMTKDDSFLNKGQIFVLAFDERLNKLFTTHVKNEVIQWDDLLKNDTLSSDEVILFTLIRTFDEKQNALFNTDLLYDISSIDYLKVALNALQAHFSLDVYPYNFHGTQHGQSFIEEEKTEGQNECLYPVPEEKLINQSNIAELFNENGITGDRRKVSAYKNKGYLPEPDFKSGRTELWKESAIIDWIDEYNAGKIIQRRNRNTTEK